MENESLMALWVKCFMAAVHDRAAKELNDCFGDDGFLTDEMLLSVHERPEKTKQYWEKRQSEIMADANTRYEKAKNAKT